MDLFLALIFTFLLLSVFLIFGRSKAVRKAEVILDKAAASENKQKNENASKKLKQKASETKKINPFKFVTAAQIAQDVAKNADVDSIAQFAHLMQSDAEKRQAVGEANEELKPRYLDALYAAFEIDEKDRADYRQEKVFSAELDRCMELGLRQILSDERLTVAFGSHVITKETGKKIEKKKSWEDLKDEL